MQYLFIYACYIDKRYTILKVLKEGLTSNKQKLNAPILKNYEYVSEPLETGISVPGSIKDCTPAGKIDCV